MSVILATGFRYASYSPASAGQPFPSRWAPPGGRPGSRGLGLGAPSRAVIFAPAGG